MRYLLVLFFYACAFISNPAIAKNSSDYVTVHLMGQFGNQLFEIATAYAYSLDHDIPLIIPNLKTETADNIAFNAKKVFLNNITCKSLPHGSKLHWSEPTFNYHPIPNNNRISLYGYFQSEKYFKHREKEIRALFAPSKQLTAYLIDKYPFFSSDSLVVGVQIRDYRKEKPFEDFHPTKKRAYYEEAMSHFSDNAIFVVSSNNLPFAKECVDGLKPNIIYLQEADYIDEFYALTLCKSFIISNSTFGWWAAWLSKSPNKKIIAPYQWFSLPYNNEQMVQDLFPEQFTLIYE